MTSTLPNFAACPATPAGTSALNSTAMAGLMSSAGVPATVPSAVNGVSFEFASLLPAPASSATVVPSALPAAPAGAQPDGAAALASQPAALLTETGAAPTLTFVVPGKIVISGKPISTKAPASASEPTPSRPHGISREEFEEAAAFVAALMQTLLPAATPAPTAEMPAETVSAGTVDASDAISSELGAPITSAVPASPKGSPWNETSLTLPNGRAFPTNLPNQAKPALGADHSARVLLPVATGPVDEVLPEETSTPLILPNGREFPTELPEQAKPALGANRSVPENLPAQARPMVAAGRPVFVEPDVGTPLPSDVLPVSNGEPVTTSPVQLEPAFTIAADGAIELKLSLPATSEIGLKTDSQPVSPLGVSAELELPGQAIIRVEATVPDGHGFNELARPVNFAGLKHAEKFSDCESADSFEINFVVTGDKQVKAESPETGIAVAKTENKMSAPTEETRNTRSAETLSVLPSRAEFQVIQSPAERITAAPAEAAGQNFAERAVATVTGLAEAQFAASMHKAGSVQLRLKFGNEDLSVRVELRGGAVHTDFRTDSPELREALAKEWQAVAASSPGHLQRFLDPVFSPASASGSTDAGSQQYASHRQPPQQQAQEQAANRQDAWHSQSPFSRRSALSESFVPEPSTPRVPVLLPTSLRLSVLA